MNTEAAKQTLLSALRHVLTAAGAIAITHGYASGSQISKLAGGAVGLLGAVWGPLDEFLAARDAQFDARVKAAIDLALQAALKAALLQTPRQEISTLQPSPSNSGQPPSS